MMRKSRFHNNEVFIFLKDDFQSILRNLCTLINVYKHCKSHSMECKSIVFFMNQIPYLLCLPSVLLIFTAVKLFHVKCEKKQTIKLHMHING